MLQNSTPCLSLLCCYLSCFYSQNTAAHFKAFFPFLFFFFFFWSQAELLLIFSLNQTKNILQFFSFNSHVSESSQHMTCHLPLSTCARYLSLLHSGNKDGSSQGSLLVKVKVTLCNSVDCSLPGSSLHGILQARILEWVAVSFSNA